MFNGQSMEKAPLYILDEVDEALDSNHTQNIRKLFKRYFPHSQFIVVSLKEEMFNNANALFRTKCVDGGVSTVQKTQINLNIRWTIGISSAVAAAAAAAAGYWMYSRSS